MYNNIMQDSKTALLHSCFANKLLICSKSTHSQEVLDLSVLVSLLLVMMKLKDHKSSKLKLQELTIAGRQQL